MLKELALAVTTAVKNGQTRVLDLYHEDACVGVWAPKITIKELPQALYKEIIRHQDFTYYDKETPRPPGGIILSKENYLRKLAEKNKCKAVRVFWDKTELEFYWIHDIFLTIEDIINYLNSLPEETKFSLSSVGKCYPAPDSLMFNVQGVWLKFRADFSMFDQPYSAIQGILEIEPKTKTEADQKTGWVNREYTDVYKIHWQTMDNNDYPEYKQYLRTKDIEVIDQCEVMAELL